LLAVPAWAADAPVNADASFLARAADSAIPDISYALRAGASYNDNVLLAPSGFENSSGAGVLGLTVSGQRATGRLTYRTSVDLSYDEYFGRYDSQLFGGGRVNGAYAFVPDTFFWNGSVNYDQVRREITAPLASGNMGGQTAWSTGPEVHLRMGSAMEAQLSGHYQSASYPGALSQSGNSTIGAKALLVRHANPRTQLALGGSYDDIGYDQRNVADVLDFKRHEVFLSYGNRGVRSQVSAELGYAGISGVTIDNKGVMFRGMLFRRLTPLLDASVSYNHEYPTSAPATFLQDPTIPGSAMTDQTLLSATPRITDTLNASLRLHRTRTEAQLSWALTKESSLAQGIGKRNYDEIRLSVSRRFAPRTTGSLYASRLNETYTSLSADSNEIRAGGLLTLQLSGALGLDVQAEYRDRSARQSGTSASQFVGGLFLRYSGALGRRLQP
jgi:hypothetical protein